MKFICRKRFLRVSSEMNDIFHIIDVYCQKTIKVRLPQGNTRRLRYFTKASERLVNNQPIDKETCSEGQSQPHIDHILKHVSSRTQICLPIYSSTKISMLLARLLTLFVESFIYFEQPETFCYSIYNNQHFNRLLRFQIKNDPEKQKIQVC